MRRILQAQGAEVIHLGHNRSVDDVVKAAVEEDAAAVAVSSYQGGHVEYFSYLTECLSDAGAAHVRVYGGGGGVIVPDEIALLATRGVCIFSPEDGQRLGLAAMVNTVLADWGPIDAVVNNAIYQGPGRMDRVLELDLDDATKLVVGNYVHQLHLIQLVVPGMLERGGGRIVNLASATATMGPPAPAGDGGWGLGYGASKAAFLRVAGQLHVEFAARGLLAFNVDPGFTTNDKPSDATFSARFRGAPPEVAAAVIAWLCSAPDAEEHAGTLVFSQSLCKRMQLLEGWPP
jgi:methylmalonyl-CoA mutase cobalamin-binding domain/chain